MKKLYTYFCCAAGSKSVQESHFQGIAMSSPSPAFGPSLALGVPQWLRPSSIGSLGHPQLCRRPCVHIAKFGTCPAGNECEYCHEMHTGSKLRRSQRRLMRAMTEEGVRTLLRPHILQRIQELELIDHASILMNLLEQEVHSDAQHAFANFSRSDMRKLNYVLARLPLLVLAAQHEIKCM